MPAPPTLGADVVVQARARIEAGALGSAQELLAGILVGLPAAPQHAGSTMAEAAALQAGVLVGLGEPYAARGWAAYAHAAYLHLFGDRDRRTLHALGLLAAVLARVGARSRAAQRYQELLTVVTELDGASSDRVLAVRADLATVEHARGQCVTARLHLANVVAEYQDKHGTADPTGLRMLARLAAMWRDCGDFDYAHALLGEARGYLAELAGPAADATQAMLAAAVRAPADQQHQCGREPAPRRPPPAAPAEKDLVAEPVDEPLVPVTAPLFSQLSYLPPHPELVPWQLPRAGPVPDLVAGPRLSANALVLVAACVGIVAVTVLFLLLVTSARG